MTASHKATSRQLPDHVVELLRAHPNLPFDHKDIHARIKIGKSQMDEICVLDTSIQRTDILDRGTGRTRVCWTYARSPQVLDEPTIRFSKWTAWRDRAAIVPDDGLTWGGVYLFARFEDKPPRKAPWPKLPVEIIYVGETKNLASRPLTSHNRIARYHELFGDKHLRRLYVSICQLYVAGGIASQLQRSFAEHLESRIDWEYTRCHHQRPPMHFKQKRRNDETS